MRNISKEYFGNKVLNGISLTICAGEIHALLGENGAGKSTLMNILFGMPVIHQTGGFQGEILINGEKVVIGDPKQAIGLGLGMVHQEFMLIPGFTVTENIKLNREILKPTILSRVFGSKLMNLDYQRMNEDARTALDRLEMKTLSENAVTGSLPVGYMQFVEIARELDRRNVKVLIFDEPTAVLTESESRKLLDSLSRLSVMGIGILFITHKLDEVMEVSHKVTVLKDGKFVGCVEKNETSVEELASMMVGRTFHVLKNRTTEQKDERNREMSKSGGAGIEIRNLVVQMPGERVTGLDLDIPKGKIFGIGGLAGQGKIGIANGIMGVYPSEGSVTVDGEPLGLNNPTGAISRGLAFVSEDRRGVGLLLEESIETNIAITAVYMQRKYLKGAGGVSLLDTRKVRAIAKEMIGLLDIRCSGPEQATGRLSGGNQQKVCLARALVLEPQFLFVSEPTRGIDIGAKQLVLEFLMKLNRERGITVVITSSELAEMKAVCDEIAIVSGGKLFGVLPADSSDVKFGLMLSGIR